MVKVVDFAVYTRAKLQSIAMPGSGELVCSLLAILYTLRGWEGMKPLPQSERKGKSSNRSIWH